MPGNLESIKPYNIAIKYLAYLSPNFHWIISYVTNLKQFITVRDAHFKFAPCICWNRNIVINKR